METQPTSPTRRLPRRPRADEPPAPARQRPRILGGRYRMEEVIGRGGMSTVHRATDTVLGRPVAVKVLLAALAESDPTHIERFKREARAVAALHHPAVVKIYDTGVDEDRHFLVMEYVDGRSLDEVLRDGRPLEPRQAVKIAAQVGEALAAAHRAGILHRDIKPANVMLASDGEVKVLDFGIARPLQEATLTQPASAMGTAAYMAPERIRGRPGDERSDVYALGCVLYAMLTGHPPFMAAENVAVLHQQLHAEPLSPRSRGASISPSLELLVLTMLAKDPAARPQTAAAVAARLRESLLDGVADTAATRPLADGAGGAVGAEIAGGRGVAGGRGIAYERADRRVSHRWLRAIALLAALVVLALAVALVSSGGRKAPRSGAASRLSHRHATGSYHEPVITTTSSAPTAPASTAPAPLPKKPHHRPKGPHGGGPPGHREGGPPGHGPKPPHGGH